VDTAIGSGTIPHHRPGRCQLTQQRNPAALAQAFHDAGLRFLPVGIGMILSGTSYLIDQRHLAT
jgi:hypothetical protein